MRSVISFVFNLVHTYLWVSRTAFPNAFDLVVMRVRLAMSRLCVCCQARACPPWRGGRSSLASLDVLSASLGSRGVQLDGQ